LRANHKEEVMEVGVAEAALRCVCGYSIYCGVESETQYTGNLAFFDNEPTSATYGQQVECCPNCGEQLGLPLFFRKSGLG
jgi:hypothetical protein